MLVDAIWEYKITEAQRINRATGFSDHLNQMAKEGWQLVTVVHLRDVGLKFFLFDEALS